MLRYLVQYVTLCGALIGGPVHANDLETGAAMPPLIPDNPILQTVELPLQITSVFAPFDFAQTMAITDRQEVIGRVDDISVGGQDTDILIVFAQSWDMALDLALTLGSENLGTRYQIAREGGFAIDYTVEPAADGPLHIYTIVASAAPYDVPTLCWARLIVASLYVGTQPAPFTLGACTQSLTDG